MPQRGITEVIFKQKPEEKQTNKKYTSKQAMQRILNREQDVQGP